jgi:hypothetical protein
LTAISVNQAAEWSANEPASPKIAVVAINDIFGHIIMSKEMLNLAWETEVENHTMKLLLVALADHHNECTEQCNPSIRRLAKRMGVMRSTITNNTKKLIAAGLISKEKDPGDGSGARSNKYTFHLGQSQSDRPPQSWSDRPPQSTPTRPPKSVR